MLDVHQLQEIAYAYFGSLRSRQVKPQSVLRFLSPILSSLASSPSPIRVAFASKQLSRVLNVLTDQLKPPAIEEDLQAKKMWTKNPNPLSRLAATVFAIIHKFPQLSSEKTLAMVVFSLQQPASRSYFVLIADLIVRESLSLSDYTAKMVSLNCFVSQGQGILRPD